MKELFPEEYGLTGRELAMAAVVKFYVSEVEGARAELEGIMSNDYVDGSALAAFIDQAVAYADRAGHQRGFARLPHGLL